jgi:DNA polymerase-3 subunit alpha
MFLNCHSYYSLRYGTLTVDELVDCAINNNVRALALTDINSTMGTVDFVQACSKKDIHPIAGIEFRNGNELLYVGIARNNIGFKELNEFLTDCSIENGQIPIVAPAFRDAYVIYPFEKGKSRKLRENEFIGIRPADLNFVSTNSLLVQRSKLIALYPVTFAKFDDFDLHLNLRAIDNNTLITKIHPQQTASRYEAFLPPDEIRALYNDFPYIIENTDKLIASCCIGFDFTTSKNKKIFTTSRYDDKILLEKLAFDGMIYRYGAHNAEAKRRIKHELDIIDKLCFSSYFLITWDIIRYSMGRDFYHVGRGSGANSIVAYCLKITNVDPIELDLYFERFINPKRTSPPDFDIDFSWKERDDVLDYIFKRYGTRNTALICAISTFRDRSIFRELGKVHGLPKEEIDRLVKNPEDPLCQNDVTRRMFEIGNRLMDFPNIRSIHAGGVLVSEEPITNYTALDLPPKGFLTTHWDMYVAEDLGYEKLDILSQRGIGHIKDCAVIVKQNRGIDIDVHEVPRFKTDPKVQDYLKRGEALGCFYVESPATRGLLKKLKCSDYITLVAASSIIRPGVAKSGMMKEYIKRFHNRAEIRYLHPVMEEQLRETFGVMVYQEDVIKVCHHFAGLDLGDADVLRRAMSGKYRSRKEFARIVEKFFTNCKEKGYTDELTKEVWRQIESFAGYSFSKAHSASFAVESFQSLFLKAYYPIEHMVAVINNFGGFYQTWVYVNEARRWGAIINLPCVNRGAYLTTVMCKDIFIGFVHVQNLESNFAQNIEQDRAKNGPYSGIDDFITRVPSGIEQLVILIRIDAFRFTGKSKKQLLWEAHMLLGKEVTEPAQQALFRIPKKEFKLPALEHNSIDDAYDEIELIGFPVTVNAFELLETKFRGEIMACDMLRFVGKKVRMLGNLVTIKNVRTTKNEWMHFGTFFDARGEFFDTVHFPNSLKQYRFRGMGIYLILGVITEEFGFPSMTVEKMAKMPVKQK